MPMYRFYTLEENGHIATPPVDCEFSNDAAALQGAKQRLDGRDITIWLNSRLVAHLAPNKK